MRATERSNKLKEIRKEDIIDAAERVFFSKGFNASMDEVAKEAEYSKRTIYIYFESKEQLYQAIINRAFRVLNDISKNKLESTDQATGYQKLRLFGEAYLEFIQTYPDYFKIITNHHFSESEYHQFKAGNRFSDDGEYLFSLLIQLLEDGVKDGSIRPDIEIIETAFILYANMMGIGNLLVNKSLYLTGVYNRTTEELIHCFYDFVTRALKNHEKGGANHGE